MKLAECHPSRKAEGRGLCKSCYDKWLKDNNPVYKQNQLSNTTQWKLKNPEKMKIITDRRAAKIKNDPNHKLKTRESTLKRNYGITLKDYDNMLNAQNGGCAICDRKPNPGKNLHIDHCHATGRVRGLLCHQCNWFLGTVDAEPDILSRLPLYLYSKNYLDVKEERYFP